MSTLKNILHNIIQEFRKKTYFRQVLLSYIIVSCFTFLIFSILLLSKIQAENDKTILKFGWQNIEQAVSFNNSALHDIANYGYQMLDEATTYKLLYNNTFDIQTSIASRDIYNRIQSSNSMITSLDFINFSTGTVLTKSHRMTLEQYYDTDLLEYINTLVPSRRPVFYQPRESYFNGNHKQSQRVLSLIFYTNNRGALVINLDYDTYASQINLSRNNNNMELFIINHNNYVMAATNDNYFMQDFSENPMYMEVQQQSTPKGRFSYRSDSGTQTILYQKDDLMGITYISAISHFKAYSRSYLFGLTFRYSIVYIIVTFILSFLFSLILYSPVKRLRYAIHSKELMPEGYNFNTKNDFDLFESAFQNLIEKYTTLKQASQTFERQREQKLLHLLLEQTSALDMPKNEDILELDNSFAYQNYMVFIINVDIPAEKNMMDTDIPLVKFVTENITTEIMAEIAIVRSVETISPRVLFLANFREFDSLQKRRFYEASQKIQDFFHQRGQFQITIGFGNVTDALDTISASYEAARTALENGMLHHRDSIIFYDDLEIPAISEQRYPFTADSEITAAIKNTNVTALDTNLDNFFETIKNFSYNQIRRYVSHLDDTLQQFEYFNGLNTVSMDNDLTDQPHMLSEYKDLFRNRCLYDIQTLTEIKLHSHSKDTLIKQVQTFVVDNIYNPNLSVIMIAENVGLSVNYLRNIYKENTGESLSAYITNHKLENIYELLSKTDMSIQEISDKLGFATKNYFFTFFKKHTGMTPSQYRNNNKG